MKRKHYSIFIQAPPQKVWDIMLNDETYRKWTKVFNPTGSYYEGQWTEGSDMKFYGPDEKGNLYGMISKIKAARPYSFVSIQHIGELNKGEVKMWTKEEQGENGVFENYTFTAKDGGTEVLVDLDTSEEYEKMFEDMWPKALQELKKLVEQDTHE